MNVGPRSAVLTFLGAIGTVTGSRFLVDTGAARVLIDAGLFQGVKRLRLLNRAPFPVDPASIDAVVLTHAHLDHTGYLPALGRGGFRGPVHLTPNTAALTAIVLQDAARLQEEEASYANRKGFSKHHPALPLYTTEDAALAISRFAPIAFDHPVEIAQGVQLTLRRAGHILGAASVQLRFTDEGGRPLFVSGDVGRPCHPLLRAPAPFPGAATALIESTYGNRHHASKADALEQLAELIRRTAERSGVVVIPAFAVDRTEVVLHALRDLRRQGRIPALPVHVDSPMALDVLDVCRNAIRNGDPEVLPAELDGDPFDPGDLHEVRSVAASIELNSVTYPSIIISSSGMAAGGRVVHHLAHRLGDPRNSVVLVGFQAEGTRGRDMADGARSIKMLGRYVPVRAEIRTIDAFSVHADSDELLRWMRPAEPPDTAFVVHGEPAASAALRERIKHDLRWTAVVPLQGERVRLD